MLRALAIAIVIALGASPACAGLGGGANPATEVYPGCMVPPSSWKATASSATNQVWHINPTTGNNANDGMSATVGGGHGPWASPEALFEPVTAGGGTNSTALLKVVNSSGVVKSGDIVYLAGGAYGDWTLNRFNSSGIANAPHVTIAAEPGQTPLFNSLTVQGTSGWAFDPGIKVQTANSFTKNAAISINGASTDIVFTGVDASSHASLDPYLAAWNGTATQSYNHTTNVLTVPLGGLLPGSKPLITVGWTAHWQFTDTNTLTITAISGATITINAPSSVPVSVGQVYRINGNLYTILSQSSGTTGQAGAYVLNTATGLPAAPTSGDLQPPTLASQLTSLETDGHLGGAGTYSLSVAQANDFPCCSVNNYGMALLDQTNVNYVGGNETAFSTNTTASCISAVGNHFHDSVYSVSFNSPNSLFARNRVDHEMKTFLTTGQSGLTNNQTIEDNLFSDAMATGEAHPDVIEDSPNCLGCSSNNHKIRRNVYVEQLDKNWPLIVGSFGYFIQGGTRSECYYGLELTDNVLVTSEIHAFTTHCLRNSVVANNTVVSPGALTVTQPTIGNPGVVEFEIADQSYTSSGATWSSGQATFTMTGGTMSAGNDVGAGVTITATGFPASGYNGDWVVVSTSGSPVTSVVVTMPTNPGASSTGAGTLGYPTRNTIIENNVAPYIYLAAPQGTGITFANNTASPCSGSSCNPSNALDWATLGVSVTCTVSTPCNDTNGNPTLKFLTQGALEGTGVWSAWSPATLTYDMRPAAGASTVVGQGAPWNSPTSGTQTYSQGQDQRRRPWPNPPDLGAVLHQALSSGVPFTALHTYYMATASSSPPGSDTNAGTLSSPWLSPNHAVNCGDVIIALKPTSGTYGTNFQANKWGTVSNCPSTSGGIDGRGGIYFATVLCAGPDLEACPVSTSGVDAFDVDVNNWAVEGFKATATGGSSIAFDIPSGNCQSLSSNLHHIAFINDVSYSSAYGFNEANCNSSTVSADYFAFDGDIAQESNSYLNDSANCGGAFDVNSPHPQDSASGTHIDMSGNFIYANLGVAPTSSYCFSDMEGLNLDTLEQLGFNQQLRVSDNIIYDNANQGIQINYPGALANTILINHNTIFGDLQDIPITSGGSAAGEINFNPNSATGGATTLTIANNIVRTNITTGNGSTLVFGMWLADLLASSTGVTVPSNSAYSALTSTGFPCYPNSNPNPDICVFNHTGHFVPPGSNVYGDPAFTDVSGTPVTAGSLTVGAAYQIVSVGTTSWTAIGANSNTVGVAFTATGAGSGTGTAVKSDLLTNWVGTPNLTGFTNTAAFMGWNYSTQTSRALTPISDLTPTESGTSGIGYQPPGPCATDATFPAWLKGIVYLQWNGASLTENSGLVPKPCGM